MFNNYKENSTKKSKYSLTVIIITVTRMSSVGVWGGKKYFFFAYIPVCLPLALLSFYKGRQLATVWRLNLSAFLELYSWNIYLLLRFPLSGAGHAFFLLMKMPNQIRFNFIVSKESRKKCLEDYHWRSWIKVRYC